MITGFVLVIAKARQEHEVFNALKAIPEVVEVHPLFGVYDIICKVQGEDTNAIGLVVVEKIRTIDGIEDTKTLTSIVL